MKVLVSLIVAVLAPCILAQIGIKTQRTASGNLIYNGTAGLAENTGSYVYSNNGTLMFINRTISAMATGVCSKEVPTVSLVKDPSMIPAGNGSNPSLSRIQVCCDGYVRNIHNFRKCDPICKQECTNGLCIAPDVCRCFPDHVRNLDGFCIPTCPIGCGDGVCQADGTCACKVGYKQEPMRKFCVPNCIPGCQNGNCTAPNVCQCNRGFERSGDGSCTPKCDNCANGRCTAPGACTCLPGFTRQADKCLPVCEKGCLSGYCIAPNVCSCERGYVLDKSGTACTPHCDTACLNGVCSGANTCKCNSGYIPDETNHSVCKPYCPAGCPNGICSGPNFCICKPGFVKDRSIKGRQVCIPSN